MRSELVRANQKKTVARNVKAIDQISGRLPSLFAAPCRFIRQGELIGHDHSLIKDKTVTLPMIASHLLQVADDPAMQLIDVFKALLLKQRRGFFTPDPTGAIHEDLFPLQMRIIVNHFWEIAKMFDVWLQGTFEEPDIGLISVAGVKEDDLIPSLLDHLLPRLGTQMGSRVLLRIHILL